MAERQVPAFAKSPPELVGRFAEVLSRHPEAERRQMFGYPAAFVGGNMATGLFADRWIVRLGRDAADEAVERGAEPFEPMPGRPMTGFYAIAPGDVADEAKLDDWVRRGLATAAAMPAKEPRARKPARSPNTG